MCLESLSMHLHIVLVSGEITLFHIVCLSAVCHYMTKQRQENDYFIDVWWLLNSD